MEFNLSRWFVGRCLLRVGSVFAKGYRHLLDLVRISAPDTPRILQRIGIMEQNIILPIKVAGIVMVLCFYLKPWVSRGYNVLDVEVNASKGFFWFYTGASAVVAALLLAKRRLPVQGVQWIAFVNCLMDGIFLGVLTLVTGGYNSVLYWVFLAMIVRGTVTAPRPTSQLLLNLTLSACYVIAGYFDLIVAKQLDHEARVDLRMSDPPQDPVESLFLRVALLVLMTVCCYGLQALLERQRRVVREAREFAMREGQLRAAGRLAAEFTHQIKNPLGIINNALFSARKALKQGKPVTDQLSIIQEEVEHSDRIIVQIMGYGELSEGRVEKLDVIEELDRAIERVLPKAAGFSVKVHRDYAPPFPPVFMQRRHLFDSFINILQNARESFNGKKGNIFVTARCKSDNAVEVSIRDDGPGIPPDKHNRIFEAYYTTKEKGTGLGLAAVKNNVEVYGGSIRVESELGKGARFVLTFPTETPMNLPGQT